MESKDSWWLLWKNALPQYGVTFAQYFIPLLTLPYLTRVLGADLYGQVVFLTAVVGYFQLVVEFGFNLSAATSISVHHQDRRKVARVRSSVLRARLLLALLAAFAYALLTVFSSFAGGFEALAIAYFASAVMNAFVPIFIFRGMERMPALSLMLILSRVAFAGLIFLLVQDAADILWVPISSGLGTLVVLVYSTWYLKHELGLTRESPIRGETMATARLSAPYFIEAISSTMLGAFTVVFISSIGLPLSQVALWGASFQLIAAAQSMYAPILASLLPRMARGLDLALVRRLVALILPAIFLASLALFLYADVLMRVLYGPDFADGSILQALVPLLVVSFPTLLLGAPILGSGGNQRRMASSTVIAGCLFILSLLLWWALGGRSLVMVALLRGVAELLLLILRLWHFWSHRRESEQGGR